MLHPSWNLSTSSTLAALAAAGLGVDWVARRGARFERIWANEILAEFYGSTPVSLLKRAPEEGLPEEVNQAVAELFEAPGEAPKVFEAVLASPGAVPTRLRVALRRADLDGETAILRCFSRPQQPGALERAIQQSDRRFRDLLEVAPDAIVIVRDGNIVYANRAALNVGGHRALEEVLGTPFAPRIHPDDLPLVMRRIAAVLGEQQKNPAAEIRYVRADGTTVPLEVVSMPTQWEGRPALLAIGRELTRRREAWAESLQADRISAVGTLAAGVAHEINNPLAYVLLNLQYIVRELPQLAHHPERVTHLRDRLAEARHGADRVRSIVRDLREFSLPNHTEVGPVDLVRVIEAALKVAATHIEGHAAVVREYLPAPMARGDPVRLEQVFLNLITNSVQAMPNRRRDQNQLRIRVAPGANESVMAEVEDNGIGIASDLIDRVFDPFFTTKPVGVGTGLGLPICYSIVTALGGSISVESQPGRGALFRVELPSLPRPEERDFVTPSPPSASTAPRARVLVIDDEQPVADILRRMLIDDFDVEVATSAQEALALLRSHGDFDVLVCDLLMPGMSGVDLYGELRARQTGLEERMIFMTGGAFTARSAEFLASVPNERLEKPLDLMELRRAVRRLAEGKP